MTQSFGLVVSGDLSDDVVDKLYSRADGITVSIDRDGKGGLIEVDFEGNDPLEALLATIDEVEQLGLRVQRLEPDELVYASEIADRTGRSRQSVDFLIRGDRGPGDFPEPITHAGSRNPLWRWHEVSQWFAHYEKSEPDPMLADMAMLAGLLNGVLETRRYMPAMDSEKVRAVLRLLDHERAT